MSDIENTFGEVLRDAATLLNNFQREDLLEYLNDNLAADINWMHQNDPASKNTDEIRFRNTTAAIAYYRLTNILWYCIEGQRRIAYSLHQKGVRQTGIDIHPAAKIDAPFAIDHGVACTIGSTTEIGKYCLLLNNVTLGSIKVGRRAGKTLRGKKRHPTIGDNVIICSNVRILGPVKIGNNTYIGSYTLITQDIPDNSKVTCISQLQIVSKASNNRSHPPIVESIYPTNISRLSENLFHLYGHGFNSDTKVELQPYNSNKTNVVHPVQYITREFNLISFIIDKEEIEEGSWSLKVLNPDGQSFTLINIFYYYED